MECAVEKFHNALHEVKYLRVSMRDEYDWLCGCTGAVGTGAVGGCRNRVAWMPGPSPKCTLGRISTSPAPVRVPRG